MNFPLAPLTDMPAYFLKGLDVDILMRIGLACVAGTLIGIERERHGRAAGLRTTLLVCLAACVAMILSDSFYHMSFQMQDDPQGWHPDPARLAAGVLSGMGFLGAGVIIRQSNHLVRGVTTAATLWFVTIIGLAFGAGAIAIGLIATLGCGMVLMLIPYLESTIKNDWYSDLGVSFSLDECSVAQIVEALSPLQVKVKGIDLEEDLVANRCHATFHLRYKRKGKVFLSDTVTEAIRGIPGVFRISFQG